MSRLLCWAACLLGACAGSARMPPEVYDFGPPVQRLSADGRWTTVALEIKTPSWLDSPAIEYRLLYENPLKLRHYAASRWAGAPGQLLAQRLREQLGLVGATGQSACWLRLELHEFAQVFDTPELSRGLLQGRAILLDARRRIVAERFVVSEQSALSADARGGVSALASASTELGRQIAAWLNDLEKRGSLKSCRSTAAESQ